HWANAVLVYFAVLVLMEKLWPAMFAATIFAVHPIVTESVTNIVGRADLFATLSVLLSFLLYAKSAVTVEDRKPSVAAWLAGLLVAGVFGVFVIVHRVAPGILPEMLRSRVWAELALAGLAAACLGICSMHGGFRSAFWLCLMLLVTTVGV